MLIPIDDISPDPENVRRIKADPEEDDALLASMGSIGLLQPILVRPSSKDDGFIITAGERRWTAAKALGWTKIEAMVCDDIATDPLAMSAAENAVRASMNPIDQWRAMCKLRARGLSLELAAQSLGVSETMARRMLKLGLVHSDLLAAMAMHGLPGSGLLATIATAPFDVQAKAIKFKDSWGRSDKKNIKPVWWRIARYCEIKRLPRSLAVFDPNTSDVIFEEDLFAEPGSDNQWTTTDIDGFLTAQTAALEAFAARSKNIVIAETHATGLKAPKGWKIEYQDWVLPKDFDFKKLSRALGDGRKTALSVGRDGYDIGRIYRCVIAATGAKKTGAKKLKGDAGGPDFGAPVAATPKPPISKKGRLLMRQMTRAFFDTALPLASDTVGRHIDPVAMVQLLLTALAAKNVRISMGNSWQFQDMEDLVARAMQAADYDEMAPIAVEALQRVVLIEDDKTRGSGDALSWMSQILADPDPRFDTEEFLQHVSHDILVEKATKLGIEVPKNPKKLRALLVGKMPDWTPPGWLDAPDPSPDRVNQVAEIAGDEDDSKTDDENTDDENTDDENTDDENTEEAAE